jgi:hypothetical protein
LSIPDRRSKIDNIIYTNAVKASVLPKPQTASSNNIVEAILKKLGITPTPPTLTGTFEEKNVTLLMGNRKALDKIAQKLGVK